CGRRGFQSRGLAPSSGPTGVKCARRRMLGFPAMTTSTFRIGLALLLALASTAALAQQATITRDDWGIAHVHGKTDADAVFGMAYAQAEDDFNRVETNYINAMGRMAEAEGEAAIWQDLRMKLFIDPAELQRLYGQSPDWLRRLMDAWAAGLNHYLDTHPDVKPRVITRFEPWMALSFSEGSIGGDIERVSLKQLAAFYGSDPLPRAATELGRAHRIQRHRDRAEADSGRQRPAADQPAHLVLLPFRTAHDQRRRPGRLRCGHLGSILHLPGLQPPRRLDAHLQRRRRGRRIRRDHRPRRRQAGLPLRRRTARGDHPGDRGSLPRRRRRHGAAHVHRLLHPPRTDRARGR